MRNTLSDNTIHPINSAHFIAHYQRLEQAISEHEGLKTIDIRQKLAKGLLWEVATLDNNTQKLFAATTNKVWLSDDTLIKQIRHRQGQPIDIESYQMIEHIINNADERVIENENNIVFFKKNNEWYKAVVKSTKEKDELYLLSFRRSDSKQVAKDTKKATR